MRLQTHTSCFIVFILGLCKLMVKDPKTYSSKCFRREIYGVIYSYLVFTLWINFSLNFPMIMYGKIGMGGVSWNETPCHIHQQPQNIWHILMIFRPYYLCRRVQGRD